MTSDPQNQTVETVEAEQAAPLELNAGKTGTLSKISSNSTDWQEAGDKVARFIDMLPDFIVETFNQYRQPLTKVGILLLALVSVAIADGVLDVVNALPLVAPLLELVGLGYTGWFIWRYLLYAETRQELGENYQNIKNRVTGKSKSAE